MNGLSHKRDGKAWRKNKKRKCEHSFIWAQGIVERSNQTLGELLFTFQYSPEINFISGKRSTKWVKRLPEVVSPLNGQVTKLTEKKPVDAIREKVVDPN